MRITVVGGGVVGLSCALRLAQRGHCVTVVDRASRGDAASWGNAGHIATEQVAPLASLATLRSAAGRLFVRGGALDLPPAHTATWLPFVLRMIAAAYPPRFAKGKRALGAMLADAVPAWQRLVQTLGTPELLRESGHHVVWESAATARAGQASWAAADIGTARFAAADAATRAALAGITTAPIAGAIHFTGTAHISDLDALATTLAHAFRAVGGRIVTHDATLSVESARAFVPGFTADCVLVCAGARSAALVGAAGHRAPLIAERGYHIRGSAALWPADLPPIVFEDRSMIVTRYGDRLQAASFVELAPVDAPPDPRKWERLERHVGDLGLAIAGPFTRWVGSRPTLPDYLPAIGRSRRAPNLFYAFGHQHLGLTLAPITAELIAGLIAGEAGPVDLTPFDLERFARVGVR
ncbi:FAD-binding oxidoreductase [Sphingomonas sp. RB3P16]|uniref:NAD(P)/FAD-dependent oxidoreductase n=1 Tax=Parasphingomonas frigoris TaxID=3096163 RepID=UPI002FC5DB0B